MTDKELKKEKELIVKALNTKIDSINSNNVLKRILEIVKKQNEILDIYDSKLDNFLDDLTDYFKPRIKDKIKHTLSDIFDKYDKKDKRGELIYTTQTRKQITELIEKINKICDENFWERFLNVLGFGS